jgi:hypothetical protein
MRVGIYDHFGWAVAVTASADHRVVDRRRLELVEPGVCAAPIHYEGKNLGPADTAALVAEVRASAGRASEAAFDRIANAVGDDPVVSISLRVWPPDFPDDIAVQLRVPYESRADAVMYRQILAEAAKGRGWQVHLYRARDVIGQAADLLGDRTEEVLQAPRTTLGPPWTKDHRIALAAAIVAG